MKKIIELLFDNDKLDFIGTWLMLLGLLLFFAIIMLIASLATCEC